MKAFDSIKKVIRDTFGLESDEQKKIRVETEWRVKRAAIERKVSMLSREATQLKGQAVELEKQGRHTEAVAKAKLYQSKEAVYQAALRQLLEADKTHDIAISQSTMVDVLRGTTAISESAIKEAEHSDLSEIMAESLAASTKVSALAEALEANAAAICEDNALYYSDGESLLAQLMTEAPAQPTAAPAETAQAVEVPEPPAEKSAEEPVTEELKSWADNRRAELMDLKLDA